MILNMWPLNERFIIEFSNRTTFSWVAINPELHDVFMVLWAKYEISIFCINRKAQTIQFTNKDTRVCISHKYDCEKWLMEQNQRLKVFLLNLKLWIHTS